jgi:hypothetical protein
MADNRNLTTFQRLNRMFGKDGIKVPKDQTNRYSIGSNELIRTTDRGEFEKAKAQAQQSKYLAGMWSKVDGELFQQSIHYETTRIGSYSDFESMEFFPEIAAALDVMMEESTTVNQKGKIMNIYSDSPRVKSILEDLFYNRLDIHTTLPMWTRNACKYGDNFIFLNIDDKAGIMGARQLPNFEVERHEGDFMKSLRASNTGPQLTNEDNNEKVKFFWKGKDIEFNSWQIAHFRLLGDDRRLPYGTSVLEKARRIWKQLLLSEDAMLIYRVTRAPERRVYKIFVGNIDDEDVPAYVNEIANRFKRAPVIDPKTGQIDLKFNQLANDQDYFIPVRNENSPNPIDTLAGAQNLDQIADIEYLQRKLFTALRVPKPFLGFDETTGEGKNLALQDVRFARTINRIQQSMIQELNKIAIIHLYLMGFEDDLDNFSITLNNPSTQQKMLEIENLQQQLTAFQNAVADAGNGLAAMSWTEAQKTILGKSEDEIRQSLLEQRMERAAAAELANTAAVIKNTGFFDKVDKIYGDIEAAKKGASAEGGEEGGAAGGGGGGLDLGGGGGLDLGGEGEDLDLGGEGEEEGGLDLGGEGDLDLGGEEGEETTEEALQRAQNILTEQKNMLLGDKASRIEKYKTNYTTKKANYVDKLVSSITENELDYNEKTKIFNKNLKINEDINGIINEIDNKLDE